MITAPPLSCKLKSRDEIDIITHSMRLTLNTTYRRRRIEVERSEVDMSPMSRQSQLYHLEQLHRCLRTAPPAMNGVHRHLGLFRVGKITGRKSGVKEQPGLLNGRHDHEVTSIVAWLHKKDYRLNAQVATVSSGYKHFTRVCSIHVAC